MPGSEQVDLVLLMGIVVAFLAGLLWAVGIRRAGEGQWAILYITFVYTAFVVILVFALGPGAPPFPHVRPSTWIIAGLTCIATFLFNLFIGPWLSGLLDESTVGILGWVVSFLASGATFAYGRWGGNLEDGGRTLVTLIGLVVFVYGMGHFLGWARDHI